MTHLKWCIKAGAFKALSVMPAGEYFYREIQQHVTRSVQPTTETVRQKMEVGLDYIGILNKLAGANWADGAMHIDLGAGWAPTIPLLFYSAGTERQVLCDIRRNLHIDRVSEAVNIFRNLAVGSERPAVRRLPPQVSPGEDLTGYLGRLGIRYAAPYGAADIAQGSQMKIVTCTQVLPYVPGDSVLSLLRSLASAFRPGDLLISTIRFYDPYADVQHKWRYSNFVWENFACSRLLSFNRLLPADYLRIFALAGFRVVEAHRTGPSPADLQDMTKPRVHRSLKRIAEEDLITRQLKIIARAEGEPRLKDLISITSSNANSSSEYDSK